MHGRSQPPPFPHEKTQIVKFWVRCGFRRFRIYKCGIVSDGWGQFHVIWLYINTHTFTNIQTPTQILIAGVIPEANRNPIRFED